MFVPVALLALIQQMSWMPGSGNSRQYTVVAATGNALDSTGADLTLRGDSAAATFGTLRAILPAETFRGQRVTLSAEIEARGVSAGASIWLRVDRPGGPLALENGTDNALRGTSSGQRQVSLLVPMNATEILIGLLLRGSGEASARHLRLRGIPAPSPDTPLAPAAEAELDSAFALVRTRALWRDTVSWTLVEPRVRALAAGAQTPADVYPAIRALLASLGDHHSLLLPPEATRHFQSGGAANPQPAVRRLADGIGYIAIPAYAGIDTAAARAYVVAVYARLRETIAGATCGWIVDLRLNGGGNMWPMLSALRPFLGEGDLGSFVTAGGRGSAWHAGAAVDIPPDSRLSVLDSSYIAVVTGPRTASSGEAVAIAFIGRPRTRSFGLQTAGLSTANATLPLPDGGMIALTVSVQADRTGQAYGGPIAPDETVSADDPDIVLTRAELWLRAASGCSAK